ncbi:aldo/keto reductase [Novosphingobium sp. JCM 18896]|uniref:aldo/keto reductase n=1 Tax=Novosphingobium sp. JCM 18896 TaxID=2989731 RepID=UPI002223BD4E|nr:aldo/keto reductase [Novosphingobium sp. JCM 18896]MCW1430726.1 aldo/keto reductase [Novosphingobium sp. JCM 18896]
MEYRQLGSSGLRVPTLSFGTGTFGGTGPLFGAWGQSDASEARRLIDICLDAGVTLFDTADVYSDGASEQILGEAIRGRRDSVLISTKTGLPLGDGPQDWGVSRARLIRAVEASLRRLGSDHIDLLQLHAFDASTPVEELMATLDQLIAAGKVRYAGVSNYPGWQLMKAQAVADRNGWQRLVAHQVYYSLIGRAYEADLMPLGADQGVGALVWSPLGWGRLTGKVGRDRPLPANSRLHDTEQFAPPVESERLYRVIDALEAVAEETGRKVPQIAINWLLQRPTVSSVIIGARNEEQLRQNLGAVGWSLTREQIAALDAASQELPPYPHTPYRQQEGFARLNPALV